MTVIPHILCVMNFDEYIYTQVLSASVKIEFPPAGFQSGLPNPSTEPTMVSFTTEGASLSLNSMYIQLHVCTITEYIITITEYILFWVCFIFIQNHVHVIYPFCCMYQQFSYLYCSVVFHSVTMSQFVHFPADEYLGCFQFLFITKEVLMSILYKSFSNFHLFLEVELLGFFF